MRKALVCLFLASLPLHADEDDFRERFADPATRKTALSGLIPGSQSAYFHTALDHQLAGREAEFARTIAEWTAASEQKENPVPANGRAALENRQLLLDYREKPAASLAGLIRRLDLKFDDTRPDAAAAAESLPVALDPALVSEAAFEKAATLNSPEKPYSGYETSRLLRELDGVADFDEAKIRWFLEHLPRIDHPGVVPLIRRSLDLPKPVNFGTLEIHRKLLSGQMAELLESHPGLRSNQAFGLAFLAKLRPGSEVDFERDPRAKGEYLVRCRDFAVGLPPALNSLKAHVLYHHLRIQEELGNYPKEDFLAFLSLPRSRHEILRVPEIAPRAPVDLDTDFTMATTFPPVRNDNALILSYLQHFLSPADSAEEYSPLIEGKSLAAFHARARLLAGGDPSRWGTAIHPEEYKSLQDEVRIGFAPGRPGLLDSDAPVALALDLKNTPEVLIRFYELDLPAYLAREGKEPGVSIDLDGLVPHHERRLTFSQPRILLHRESIPLPELAGPGAWLVDFTGGRVSARALIRKGRLAVYQERAATGQVVRVFDEKGIPVRAAGISLGRENFTADAGGRIVIPDAASQPVTRGIVRAGKLAAPISLGTRGDELALEARFHLDREQLLADRETRLQLRVRLTNHGHELPLDRIKDPALVLKAKLLGGVTTERVIEENLTLTPAFEVPFQVPADLLELTLTLRGTVAPAAGGDPVKLSAHESYSLNADLENARLATAFFSPTADGHRLEVRGRNGEPLPSRAIRLECRHDGYVKGIFVEVRTDAEGCVALGKLDTIDVLTATGTGIADAFYLPNPRDLDPAKKLQVATGTDILLPLEKPAENPDRLRLSLLEMLDGISVRDHFDKFSIDAGQLLIRGLPPGDFQLQQGGKITEIHVSSGVLTDGLLISAGRIMPVHLPARPFIASAEAANGGLRIQLGSSDPAVRISMVGKRYRHSTWNSAADLRPFSPRVSPVLSPGFHGCGFLTERRLSDEMRYILDRRASKTFAGSMLPRPGLLLNRWTAEDAAQDSVSGGSGVEGSPSAAHERQGKVEGDESELPSLDGTESIASTCDFLAIPAVVRFDLKPDADGSLTLPLADFEGCQFIQIVAAGDFASDTLVLPLPANGTPLRDLRIARPLDPRAHHVATRAAAVLAKGAEASIENLLDADWRAFTTLAEAHQFLYGMVADDHLRDFVFLPDWPEFDEAKKLELLATHACLEFHVFLARKDKAFFEKHVKPLLAGKPEPAFIDDLLLGRDLTAYLRPYAWQRLNAAEKALLSQALPDARARISRELSLRWELEAPGPDVDTSLFSQTLRGSDLALQDTLGLARNQIGEDNNAGGVGYLTEKLRRIIIPSIDFENTSLDEAVDFLRLRSSELDTLESDPAKKGVNFILRQPRGSDIRIRELRVRNIPLSVALKYICDQAKWRYKVDDFSVTLVPQTETGEDLITRTFKVPSDFRAQLDGGGSTGSEVDPFAEPADGPAVLSSIKPIAELLKAAGIAIPEGASATLSPDGTTLLVTNTPTELDKVEQLTEPLGCIPIAPGRLETAAGFEDEPRTLSASAANDSDPFADPSAGNAAFLRPGVARFPERTRVWRESNYYKNQGNTGERMIPLNRFWLDLAAWDGNGVFLSPYFNACSRSANEALLCLALLDLPFKAERPEVTVDGSTLKVKAREPMLLFYKDTRRTENVAAESPLLVRQIFSPLAEPFRTVNGRQVENPVSGDFRPGVAYSASLVVTNPTGIGRRIDLLAQIPAGSIPLGGNTATLSSTHEIDPHGVVMRELSFYFPAEGDFAVYPMHVSEEGTVLAHTGERNLRVSNGSATGDAASWQVIARDGSNDEVLERLRVENFGTIDLTAIRWRLKDRGFFLGVVALLRERLHFSAGISSYGFFHDDPATIREYLENSTAVQQLGQWLDSPLLEVRPRTHHDWETLEFDPLVNARAHRFGGGSRLTHELARDHYHAFLDQLAWKPELDAADQLTLSAFLFLQDRVEEGLARFDGIDPVKLPGRLNYDYLRAIVLFHREQPAIANEIALDYRSKTPPGLWRDRFQAVVDQADEIAAPAGPSPAEDETPATRLELAAGDGGKLVVTHRSTEMTSLRLFSVDLEVLFSANPFLQGADTNSSRPAILPNGTIDLPRVWNVTETTVDLPPALRQGNVLVSAESGSTKILKTLDSRSLDLRHLPLDRTVQVLDSASSKPLPKTYVKVYAETRDGDVVFHKDGYTDLRGKFDYLTHTGVDPSTIKRLALLVSHPEKGARTVIYDR